MSRRDIFDSDLERGPCGCEQDGRATSSEPAPVSIENMLTVITASQVHTRLAGRLAHSQPSSWWFDPKVGWLIEFGLRDGDGATVAFTVRWEEGEPRVAGAVEVVADGDRLIAAWDAKGHLLELPGVVAGGL